MIQWTSSKVMAPLKFIHNSSITQNAWGAWSVWWWAGSSQLTEDDRRPGVNLLVIQECRLRQTTLLNGNMMWCTQFMNKQIYDNIWVYYCIHTEFKRIAKDGQTTRRSRKSQWSTSLCGLRRREIRKGWMVSVCLEMRPWLSNDMKISVCHFSGICEAGSLSQGLMVTSMPCWRLFFFLRKLSESWKFLGQRWSKIWNLNPWMEISMEFWVQFLDRRTILLLEHNLPTTFARFRPSMLPQSLLGKSWLIKQSRLPFC